MLIISASNVATTGAKSRSLMVAKRLHDLLLEKAIPSEVVDLREHRIEPCDMCEGCTESGLCVQGDGFDRLKALWDGHDTIVVVCPHYAGVPARLMAMLEKIQEMSYLLYCQGRPGGKRKEALVIAHGGMTEDYETAYGANLLTPLSNALRSCGCEVLNDGIGEPLCFGVKKYYKERGDHGLCFRKDDDEAGSERIIGLAADALIAREAARGARA